VTRLAGRLQRVCADRSADQLTALALLELLHLLRSTPAARPAACAAIRRRRLSYASPADAASATDTICLGLGE
jgi:hypothetical protein